MNLKYFTKKTYLPISEAEVITNALQESGFREGFIHLCLVSFDREVGIVFCMSVACLPCG